MMYNVHTLSGLHWSVLMIIIFSWGGFVRPKITMIRLCNHRLLLCLHWFQTAQFSWGQRYQGPQSHSVQDHRLCCSLHSLQTVEAWFRDRFLWVSYLLLWLLSMKIQKFFMDKVNWQVGKWRLSVQIDFWSRKVRINASRLIFMFLLAQEMFSNKGFRGREIKLFWKSFKEAKLL